MERPQVIQDVDAWEDNRFRGLNNIPKREQWPVLWHIAVSLIVIAGELIRIRIRLRPDGPNDA
jgi:hypothetical protein